MVRPGRAHAGSPVNSSAAGSPGTTCSAPVTAGVEPASSLMRSTTSSANVYDRLTVRRPCSSWNVVELSVPRAGAWSCAPTAMTVTCALHSWMTLPASLRAVTSRVNGAPAWIDSCAIAAIRCRPLEMARTCVALVAIAGRVRFVAVSIW